MRRSVAWLIYAATCIAVIGAMGWMTRMALGLERATRASEMKSELEERLRQAMWQLDVLVAPIIASEGARPYFQYLAFYPAERAYSRMFDEIAVGEPIIASPVLSSLPPYVLLHFQIDGSGAFTSPQIPAADRFETALDGYAEADSIADAEQRLASIRSDIGFESIAAATDPAPSFPDEALSNAMNTFIEPQRDDDGLPDLRAQVETQLRQTQETSYAQTAYFVADVQPERVTEGLMKAAWIADRLMLLRSVRVGGEEFIQGVWLDWPAMRTAMLARVADLLPEASLEPAPAGAGGVRGVGGLPVRLAPGTLTMRAAGPLSPARQSLLIGWGSTMAAVVAAGFVLHRIMTLSERRAAFVSAVTHELRTPLTTFRMYTDMLADDAVQDPLKRRKYLETLRAEATRLGRLVENVLTFAQLERRGRGVSDGVLETSAILQRVSDRLVERAGQAGMQFEGPDPAGVEEIRVHADEAGVEQILFNLVENACKYAAGARDRRIVLETETRGRYLALSVRDFGPGVSLQDRRVLFKPFRQSRSRSKSASPGVGLGLALSRRLAKKMGGDLLLEQSAGDGATFTLLLRRV